MKKALLWIVGILAALVIAVACLWGGEIRTVKTLETVDGNPYLFPENDNYSPIPFNKEGCKILGKVVGLHRYSIN